MWNQTINELRAAPPCDLAGRRNSRSVMCNAVDERKNYHRTDETPGSGLQKVNTLVTKQKLVSTGSSSSSKLFRLFVLAVLYVSVLCFSAPHVALKS